MSTRILVGDVRERLKSLDPESIHTCVTSPPYWNCRDYQTEPQVWGGVEGCAHSWEPIRTPRPNSGGGKTEKQSTNAGSFAVDNLDRATYSARCAECGAIRCELGAEPTVEAYVANLVEVFRLVRRVLRRDGTLWLNLGDSFADKRMGTLKRKELALVPHRVALALQADGWYVRMDCIWDKPNAYPESVQDRPSKTHEHVLMLSRNANYFCDMDAVREPHRTASNQRDKGREPKGNSARRPVGTGEREWNHPGGRNLRSVWRITTKGYRGSHTATMPIELAERCLRMGASAGGCCPSCRAPYRRLTRKGERLAGQRRACGGNRDGEYHGRARKDYARTGAPDPSAMKARILAGMRERETLGWVPSCACAAAAPIPCTALDPFLGSGTTLLVARRLGVDGIGIELSRAYADEAERRIADDPGEAPLRKRRTRVLRPAQREMSF